MHKPKNIETIKTVLLVVLFLSTVLLLYFFWDNLSIKNLPFFDLGQTTPSESTPAAMEVTLPEEVAVHFGGGIYTVLLPEQQNMWKDCLDQMRAFSQNADATVEEITYEKYLEVMNLRSISYSFSYDIPFSSFCEKYGIARLPLYDQIDSLRSVSYSVGSPQSLFIEDGANGRYYRLVGRKALDFFKEKINQAEQQGYTAYYRLGALVGGKNRTIIPLAMEAKLKEIPYTTEAFNKNEQVARNYAQLFFGSSLDFTRRLTESKGTIIYMYGYGQKVLRMNVDGSVEYKEELTGSHLPSQDYFEGLDLALEFVNGHGTWNAGAGVGALAGGPSNGEDSDRGLLHPYMQQVQAVERNKVKGYRFIFGFKAAGKAVYYEKDQAVIVEVLGGQVTYYRRDLMIPKAGALTQEVSTDFPEMENGVVSIGNMLAPNYEYLANVLKEAGRQVEGEDQEGLFNSITEQVQHVESGYMRGEKSLIPVWIIRIGGIPFYFDLYDGKLLGHGNMGV